MDKLTSTITYDVYDYDTDEVITFVYDYETDCNMTYDEYLLNRKLLKLLDEFLIDSQN